MGWYLEGHLWKEGVCFAHESLGTEGRLWRPASKITSSSSYLLAFTPSYGLIPHEIELTGWSRGYCRNGTTQLDHKIHYGFCLVLSLSEQSVGSQLPCYEDKSSPWKVHVVKDLGLLLQASTNLPATSESAPVKHQMTPVKLATPMITSSGGGSDPDPPGKMFQQSCPAHAPQFAVFGCNFLCGNR